MNTPCNKSIMLMSRKSTSNMNPKPQTMKWLFILFIFIALVGLLLLFNNVYLAHRHRPLEGTTQYPPQALPQAGDSIRLMAYNIAKGLLHPHEEHTLKSPAWVHAHLAQAAEVIRQAQPDIVFLNEVLWELPFYKNQVLYLAEQTQMHYWAFGETFNWGWPGLRGVSGSAVLSRYPLRALSNHSFHNLQPLHFKTHKSLLLLQATLGSEPVLLGAVHHSHHDWHINYEENQHMLEWLEARPAVLAGDFNVPPEAPGIRLLQASQQFSGVFEGPPTSPDWDNPSIQIDFIFAPKSWQLLEHKVIPSPASDHKAVLSVFRLPVN